MVSVAPTHSAARSTPISASDRSYSSRNAGTRTGSPIASAEKLACASVPAARTAHRYGFGGYSPKGLIGRAPVETITLFVSR